MKTILFKILMLPVRLVDKLLDRLFAIAGAVFFVQVPSFISEYSKRLEAHISELKRVLEQHRNIALKSGRSLGDYIRQFIDSPSESISESGRLIESNLTRLKELSGALSDIKGAEGPGSLVGLIGGLDFDIFRATLKNYNFVFPLNKESIIYAAAGMVCGILIYMLLKKTLQSVALRIFGKSMAPVKKNADLSFERQAQPVSSRSYPDMDGFR